MHLTDGFAGDVNADKISNTFEAAEAMGLIFCQPERDIEYYREDLRRYHKFIG